MIRVGTIADDLTGATTAAALFARGGVSSIAYWDVETAEQGQEPAEAVLLSTNSRAMKGQDAYRVVRRATRVLRRMGAQRYQKRIDTTLRGGIGIEIDAMLDELDGEYIAVVVPAMPQSRKVVVEGVSLIDGRPLSETEVRNDALTPVHESFVPKLLGGQTRRIVGQITMQTVAEGAQAVASALRRLRRSGVQVVVADAASLRDIEVIAEGCQRSGLRILSVDPGQFTTCLLRADAAVDSGEAGEPPEAEGTVLVTVGSTTALTCHQIEMLCADPRHIRIRVDAEALLGSAERRESEIRRAVEETLACLAAEQRPRAIVLETASASRQLSRADEERRDFVHASSGMDPVNDALGEILLRTLQRDARKNVRGLYVSGGDTMVSVLSHMDARCVSVLGYIIPQVDICRLVGGRFDGMTVVSKGGLTGDAGIANMIVGRILREAAKEA